MKRRSTHFVPVLLAIASLSTAAIAEEADAPSYDGTWAVLPACKAGTVCSTRIALDEFDGTEHRRAARLHRLGRRRLGELPELTVIVKPVDAKTSAGTFDTEGHGRESAEVQASHSAPADGPRTAEGEPLSAPSASTQPIRLRKTR